MAYNEDLARRIAAIVGVRDDVEEKKMFGGVAFMVAGKMACGIVRDDLMARIGPDDHDAALREPHVRPMDFAGRPMKGMIYVAEAGWSDPAVLRRWVDASLAYVDTLPAERPKAPRTAAKKPVAKKPVAKKAGAKKAATSRAGRR